MTFDLPYRLLARRIDMNHTPAPLSDSFIGILKYLYSRDEAWLVSKMPFLPSSAKIIAITQFKRKKPVEKILTDLVDRGLLLGLTINNTKKYQIPAAVPGFFEIQLMDGKDTPLKRKFAKDMNHLLLNDPDTFYGKYDKMKSSFARVVPVNKSLSSDQKALHYEDARYIINSAKKFAISHCYCRQEKKLIGENRCNAPIEICMTMGFSADYVIDRNLGKEVDKDTMLKKLDLAETHQLVHLSDNYKNGDFTFICNCCGCCCGVLGAITRLHRTAPLVLSSKIISLDMTKCNNCGKCSKTCQVQALSTINKLTVVSSNRCVGCGYCINTCKENALSLIPRTEWHEPPEDYGDMVADLFGRRIRPGFRLPFKALNGHKKISEKVNKMINEISP